MKRSLMLIAALAIVTACGVTAKADPAELQQILYGGQNCDHVIHLMLKHGVNNDHPIDSMLQPTIHGPVLINANDIGDLELIQIQQLPHDDPACGPKFTVAIKNNSTRDVAGFRVTLVALFGRIKSNSPTAITKVDKICAGQVAEISVQLPIDSMAMGNANGQILAFQKLLVVIDSFDQFIESNEANNLRVFDRTSIPTILPAATSTPVSVVPTPAQPVQTIDSAVPPPPTPATTAPVANDELSQAIEQFTNPPNQIAQ